MTDNHKESAEDYFKEYFEGIMVLKDSVFSRKQLFDFAKSFAKQEVEKACKEQRFNCNIAYIETTSGINKLVHSEVIGAIKTAPQPKI